MIVQVGAVPPPAADTIIVTVAEIDLVVSIVSVAVIVAEYVPADEGVP